MIYKGKQHRLDELPDRRVRRACWLARYIKTKPDGFWIPAGGPLAMALCDLILSDAPAVSRFEFFEHTRDNYFCAIPRRTA